MIVYGWLVEVRERSLGNGLAEATSAGDTVLRVDTAADFDNTLGGQILIEDDAHTLVGVTSTPTYDLIEITPALTRDFELGTFISPNPPSQTLVGRVQQEDTNNIIDDAVVSHSLKLSLDVGVLQFEERLYVALDDALGYWTIQEILDTPARLSGEVVVGIPKTDGLPPAEAPSAAARAHGVGSVAVEWDRVENPDRTSYEVVLSRTSPVPLDGSGTHRFATGDSVIAGEVEGEALDAGVTVYARVRAFDDDGAGPWSSEVSATTRTVDFNDVSQALKDAIEAADQKAIDAQADADQALQDALDAWNNAQSRATPAQVDQAEADAISAAAADATAKADAAQTAATNVANSKGKVLFQSTAPGSADRNNRTLWVDTTNGANTPKRWTSGTTWVAVTDKAALDAASAAAAAQSTADSKASPEYVQQLADAAQAAAEAAAAADATAKAEAAEANAAATAAADASAKAEQARTDAEAAAQAYADQVAAGEGSGALAAAKTYAEQKAAEAQAAAEAAAAADATAKAEQAEADAAATAAADATAKANTAKSEAISAAAADATTKANAAQTAATNVANSKGKVLFQSTAPGAADRNAQTLWVDTTGGANTPKRWTSGTTWVAVTDKAATDAASAAAAAQTAANNAATAASTADGKAVAAQTAANNAASAAGAKGEVIFSSSTPAADKRLSQNLWIDTGNGNIAKRWNGSAWVAVQDQAVQDAASQAATARSEAQAAQADADAAASAASTAQTAADNAASAAATADGKAVAAQTAANNAQSTANGKGKVIFSGSAPAAADRNAQTLWIDTANGNVAKRWTSGSTWVIVQDAAIQAAAQQAAQAKAAADAAQADATTALASANGKNTRLIGPVLTGSTTPPITANTKAGDTYFGRQNGVVKQQWTYDGSAWSIEQVDVSVIANLDAGVITAWLIESENFLGRLAAFEEVTAEMISAEFVAALEIEAQQIVSGAIESDIGLLGRLIIGDFIVADGNDSSVTIYADSARTIPLIQLRPEGSVFRGQVIADDISILNGLLLQGVAEVANGSEIVLKAGATNPTLGPSLSQVTLQAPWPAVDPETHPGVNEKGVFWRGAGLGWYRLLVPSDTSQVPGGCGVQRINEDGTHGATIWLGDVLGIGEFDARGIVEIGDYWYVAFRNSTGWRVAKFLKTGAFEGTTSDYVFADAQATVGTDGTNVLLCRSYNSNISVLKMTPATLTTTWQLDLPRQSNWSAWMYSVQYGQFDFSSPKLVIAAGQTARVWDITGWHTASPSATYNEEETFDLGSSIAYGGFGWRDWEGVDGEFWSVISGQEMNLYSGSWEGTPDSVTVAYADYAGAQHTTVSRHQQAVRAAGRRYIRVTLPPLIGSATTSRVYAVRSAWGATVANSALKRRPEALTGRSLVFDPSTAGTSETPPTTNTFTAGPAAVFRSENSTFYVNGSGEVRVPDPSADTHPINRRYFDTSLDERFRSGEVQISFPSSSSSDGSATVTFETPMRSVPKVSVTALSATNGNLALNMYVTNKTVNGFQIRGRRGGPATISFDWVAVAL